MLRHNKADLPPRRSTLPKLDREILDLGVRWVGYDGAGEEDILIMFGWSEIQYFEGLRNLVERHVVADESLRRRLVDTCE